MFEATTRRRVLGAAAGGFAAAGLGRLTGAADAADDAVAAPVVSRGRTKIVVLGSQGGQQITQRTGAAVRCGTSVLIDVDGVLTVLDCGCGSVHRLAEAGYDASAVRTVLITHHHFDHVAELGSFASYSWSSGRNGVDIKRRLDIYGPTGTKAYEKGFKQSVALSIVDQEGPLGQQPTFDRFAFWHEMAPPARVTKIFSDTRVDVRAIRVHHGSMPAVGYRIRTPDVDMVFSGDRGATGDSFAKLAKGASVLFHEILDRDIVLATLKGEGQAQDFVDHIVDDHCRPETVGRVATAAGVGTLVLYHLIPGTPLITDEAWIAMVRPFFGGTIIVARDLLVV